MSPGVSSPAAVAASSLEDSFPCPDCGKLGREAPARVPVILPLFAFRARWWFNPLLTLHLRTAEKQSRAFLFKKKNNIIFFFAGGGGGSGEGDWHPLRGALG